MEKVSRALQRVAYTDFSLSCQNQQITHVFSVLFFLVMKKSFSKFKLCRHLLVFIASNLNYLPLFLFFFKAVSALLTFIQPWFIAHNLHEPPVWKKNTQQQIHHVHQRVTLKHLYEKDSFCNWNKFKHSCDLPQVVITTCVFPAKCIPGL